MSHQYTAQLEEEVRDAVFGNVGTIISFRIGAEDAEFLEKEFFPEFMANDFVNLGKYHIYVKLMIDGLASRPFSAYTLDPTVVLGNSNKEKIGKWRDSMDRSLASLHFQKIHNKKLQISLKFWIRKERLQNRKNDLDNLTKPVLDSMKRIGMIEDDAFIYRLEVSKYPTNGEEEVQLVIKEWRT